MNTPNTCPKCGSSLPTDAPEGLCPACLMQGGFATDATIRMTPSQKPTPSQPVPTPLPEELAPLFPQLEIIELLGRGGMGAVYKARQPKLNRFVALKIISAEAGADPQFAERFQREAQALAKLNHPNIVSVFDFGESEGLFYFLMEFVDGANLRTLIRSGEMKPEAALALIPAFCDALQYAHDEGVVHRDIKPENVLVDKKGRIKIADFGLAKLLGHDAPGDTLTRTGMHLGTPRYMAPEQVDKPDTVDHRADIYSLGVVFYEMLTGEIPMGRFAPPSQKVQVDIRFDEIVLHAMERDVELRYQHVSEVKTAVEKVTSRPQAAPVTSSMSPVQLLVPIDPPEQRLSLHALWGATLAVPGIATWCMLLRTIVIDTSSEGAWMAGGGKWETGQVATFPGGAPLFAVMIVVGLGALCASTFLGRTAIAQIKGSGGKIYGLPLATFARMLIPLLVIGTVALALTHILQIVLWTITHTGYSYQGGVRTNVIAPSPANRPIMTFICFDLIVALTACFFAGRSAWRKIVGRPPSSPKAEVDVGVKIRHAAIGLLLAGILDAFAGLVWIGGSVSALVEAMEHGAPLGWLVVKLLLSLGSIAVVYYTIGSALFLLHRNDDGNITFPLVMAALSPPGCIFGLPAAIYALVLLSKPEVKALFPQAKPEAKTAAEPEKIFRREAWWFGRSQGAQKVMRILLGVVFVLSLLCFFSFRMQTTTTADHSGVVRNLRDVTVGLGDPWLYLLHHKTGTRGGTESGMNFLAGSALFGLAALFAGTALTRLTREQKRRRTLADPSADTPQQKFFLNAVAGAVLFIAGIGSMIVFQVRIDLGPRWADAKQVHPDFTRPGSMSLAIKKAIADELKLTPEQLEKVNAALNRAQFDFLKLENDHSIFRSMRGRLVKEIKPFPDRSFDLAQRLAKELRDIAGKDIIDTPVRGEVWKLGLFGHAGEFNVRAEIWQENGQFHVEDVWERDGEKITGKSGEGFDMLRAISGGTYVLDWEAERDILHEPRPDDATTGFTKGWDTMQVFIDLVRLDELSQMLALDPKTVRATASPRAALITQAGTNLGRALAETQLKLHGILFAKDATPEALLKKLEQLLGAPPAP
ncbi:MAG: serine/threonine-protein kinase [Prosthecobacter sp.]|uniref:serine/threonine-protein kinase n=1 Tax=Prosthecobacter sp. TaxID=1965333 RepID=UPI003902BF2B